MRARAPTPAPPPLRRLRRASTPFGATRLASCARARARRERAPRRSTSPSSWRRCTLGARAAATACSTRAFRRRSARSKSCSRPTTRSTMIARRARAGDGPLCRRRLLQRRRLFLRDAWRGGVLFQAGRGAALGRGTGRDARRTSAFASACSARAGEARQRRPPSRAATRSCGLCAPSRPSDGALSEQFDRTTGAQTSAKHLTWSYAAFITAAASRAKALPATSSLRPLREAGQAGLDDPFAERAAQAEGLGDDQVDRKCRRRSNRCASRHRPRSSPP